MASRMKEDEKNEKIIRGLLKLSSNKRCINCNSLGPQYVCTNFWTFVCTNCGGIHREFTHRVKSVSMAKFTSQEVSALQGGGNECAREIYFKELDPQRHFLPDRSNVEKLRDFIKHVYVERRYTGESTGRLSRMKGERDDASENRRVDTFRGSSRSPPYEDTYESRRHDWSSPGGRNSDRNFRYSYDERKSPRSNLETRRYGSQRRSTARFEVVDDRVRDDRFRNRNQNRKPEDRSLSEGASKPEGRSPNHQKDVDTSSPPVVRPVRDILGEDVPPLQIGDSPKANGSMSADASARTQRTASSNNLVSTDRGSAEIKRVNSGSLIDFNLDPEPPVAAASSDPFTGQIQTVPQPTTSPSVDGGNWASFGFAGQEKAPQSPSNATTLESALSQLSAPETAAAPQAPSSATTLESALSQLSTPETAPAENMLALPVHYVESYIKTNDGRQLPAMQQKQQPSLFSAVDGQSTVQQVTPPVGGAPNNQQLNSLLAPNAQGLLTAPPTQPSQAGSKLPQAMGAAIPSQPLPAEAKPSGRKELPEDLFTITYSPAPVPVLGWQAATPHGMGFGMQYPNSMPAFPQQSKSTNPFDLGTEPTPVHASMFPSMASLQPVLLNVSLSSPLSRNSSFGASSPQWVPPQMTSYPSAIPPGAYMMQQAPSNMSPMRHQDIGGFGSAGAAFGMLGADQQFPRYPQPTTPNSISSPGGNPFG
ncbi:probable ADP-ribosylation factor GTPase-activating protein AGD14 isoform X2 [Magnolia sinica]|uniref:probable ADP-ribosylation factor GTPase-activating protein AGD14 isoform X2 n=1 Tax=Magnolia sinica TaxID=86752 RepID=UPI0026597306|nr:probable ADP-ribosylation factor GTPase-activating protein AGD14 isoform X2 [Magnolia sinica]